MTAKYQASDADTKQIDEMIEDQYNMKRSQLKALSVHLFVIFKH